MQPHTIFMSQAAQPLKGLHQLLEALPLILRLYPDTRVFVAGTNFVNRRNWREKLKFGTYANYIRHLIRKYRLEEHVMFTGPLQADAMRNHLLNSHVYVCPSAIENSPNSLGEAQLLGVPCVASNCGGIPDMVEDGVTGTLYPFAEHEFLAAAVCRIFEQPQLAEQYSENGRKAARRRHDSTLNARKLNEIYLQVGHND